MSGTMRDALDEAIRDVLEYDRDHPASGGLRTRLDTLFNRWNEAALAARSEAGAEGLREALLHATMRRHEHSDGCDGCLNVQRLVRAALAETEPKPQRVDEPFHEWHQRTGVERDETCYDCKTEPKP